MKKSLKRGLWLSLTFLVTSTLNVGYLEISHPTIVIPTTRPAVTIFFERFCKTIDYFVILWENKQRCGQTKRSQIIHSIRWVALLVLC